MPRTVARAARSRARRLSAAPSSSDSWSWWTNSARWARPKLRARSRSSAKSARRVAPRARLRT